MSTPICNNNSNTLLLFNQGWHFHSLLHFSFFHFTKNRRPKINKPRCTFPQRYKNCWKNKFALNEPRRKHYAGDGKIKKPEKKLSGFSQQRQRAKNAPLLFVPLLKNQRCIDSGKRKVVAHYVFRLDFAALDLDIVQIAAFRVNILQVQRRVEPAFVHHIDCNPGFNRTACAQSVPDI